MSITGQGHTATISRLRSLMKSNELPQLYSGQPRQIGKHDPNHPTFPTRERQTGILQSMIESLAAPLLNPVQSLASCNPKFATEILRRYNPALNSC